MDYIGDESIMTQVDLNTVTSERPKSKEDCQYNYIESASMVQCFFQIRDMY